MMEKKNQYYSNLPLPLLSLMYIICISVVLYVGKSIFIPLSFAVLISFVLYPICAWMEKKGLRRITAIAISISVLVLLAFSLGALFVKQFLDFFKEWPTLQHKLAEAGERISQLLIHGLGIPQETFKSWMSTLADQSGGNVFQFLQSTISASAFSAVLAILVPVYCVLILYYRSYWVKIVYRLFPGETQSSVQEIIDLTIRAYYNFIKGMGVVYLIVGTLNSIGLLILGVPHAILFGFIASILTFIPYIGIIVGSLLPITMAWITYDSMWYPIGIIGIFTFVQYLEANVIFPMAVSHRLNVNTLVMLLAIFTGGLVWGMAGMILFVPFIGIAKLIADHNPKWETLSMILGMSNKLNTKGNDD
jgi:predicted PurR-regulated permease PerM